MTPLENELHEALCSVMGQFEMGNVAHLMGDAGDTAHYHRTIKEAKDAMLAYREADTGSDAPVAFTLAQAVQEMEALHSALIFRLNVGEEFALDKSRLAVHFFLMALADLERAQHTLALSQEYLTQESR